MAKSVQRKYAIGSLVLGFLEVLVGLTVITLSVIMTKEASFQVKLSPYWAGIAFAVPGILGILVGVTKNSFAMILFMILNIICCVTQLIGIIFIGIFITIYSATAASNSCSRTPSGDCVCLFNHGLSKFLLKGAKNCDIMSAIIKVMTTVLVFLGLSAIVSLSASIIGCMSVFFSKKTSQAEPVLRFKLLEDSNPTS